MFNVFFAAAKHAVLVRFSEDEYNVRDLVHLEEDVVVGKNVPLASVRRAVWGMLYADDAGIVSKSANGLAEMMTVTVTVRSSRPHSNGQQHEHDAGTNPGPYIPRSTTRDSSSLPEV